MGIRIERDLPIGSIRMDRWSIGPATLALVDHLRAGGKVPPIHVMFKDGAFHILDGRHRVTAYKLLGAKTIRVRYGRPTVYPWLMVACPACAAEPGVRCRTFNRRNTHFSRISAYAAWKRNFATK